MLLPTGIKFPPIEKGWQEKGHSFQEAAAHKGNVGILAGNGFIGLDKDDPSAFEGLELPTTTTWETRPGRFGLWFKASDDIPEALAGIGKRTDQAQLKLFKNGKPCGEVKIWRTYQVIPPSWKTLEDGSRADYMLLQDVPPAEIRLVALLEGLQAIGIAFSSKLESNAAKLEDMGRKAHQRHAESDESRARRYAEAALEDEVKSLESSNEGNRNDQLNRSAFALGQFVAAGVLSEAKVIRALSNAAIYAGLEMEEIRATITSGLEAGARHPREIPEQTRRKAEDRKPEGPTVLTAFQALIDHEDRIKARALEVLKNEDPVQYVADSCGRMVLGAEAAFKKLVSCVSVQNIRQSSRAPCPQRLDSITATGIEYFGYWMIIRPGMRILIR